MKLLMQLYALFVTFCIPTSVYPLLLAQFLTGLTRIIASTHRHIVKQSLLFVIPSTNRTRLDLCSDRHLPVGTCHSEKFFREISNPVINLPPPQLALLITLLKMTPNNCVCETLKRQRESLNTWDVKPTNFVQSLKQL